MYGLIFSASVFVVVGCDSASRSSAHEVNEAADCQPTLDAAWVRLAPPDAPVMAGYAVLNNPCQHAIEVVDVESKDFAMAMLHRTESVDGVSTMRDAGALAVPAGGSLQFAPGGLHIMLGGAEQSFNEGDRVRIRLVLADGQRVFSYFELRRDAP